MDQLPTRTSKAGRPTATNAPATVAPRTLQSVPVATKAANAVRKAGRAGVLVRQGAGIVRQAASAVRSLKQARPAAAARPTAGKGRRPTKPPRRDDGLPSVNLPVSR